MEPATADPSLLTSTATSGTGGTVTGGPVVGRSVAVVNAVRDSSVSIQWQGPSTDDQPTVDRFSDNTLLIKELVLGPLTLAHGGDYTCTAVYTVDGHTATVRSGVESVVPTSELSLQSITDSYCTWSFQFHLHL